jgi:hypothetical protein
MIARSAELAELLEEQLFERDIARAKRGAHPRGIGSARGLAVDQTLVSPLKEIHPAGVMSSARRITTILSSPPRPLSTKGASL